ncbi:tripartite tricarboxylate transporter TctB family protein [Cognatiyoonia sp. IB215182]|uniref:tripartite tricarboxylate transporter TctB family protein n=1 Tax=Cognatiyoonia sp. IB215182 TaxID=3097353 RepID=UPI002A13431B|nr:tripartite tricarboxylate transporter TctB family protein [Cognatiyoonia sp. IB215182]MDX8352454.1 tripartite tricarboxylate transporter TctB family protein [Cognatiyoonia sp. IB215182]
MNYRSRIDLGVAATVMTVGAVFAVEAWRIDPASYEAIGPRAVPVFLACLMMGLGALIGVSAFGSRQQTEQLEPADFGFRNSDVSRVLAVIGAGAVTTFVFWAAGYLVAMILGTLLMLWVFGVRSPLVLIFAALAAGVVYQFVFMGLMGLLDPRGALIDLRWLSRLITPGS